MDLPDFAIDPVSNLAAGEVSSNDASQRTAEVSELQVK